MKWTAYFRLMRFHKPVGILLLGLPIAWALWIAYNGRPPLYLSLLFLFGTVIMRAAGCVMNDIADRQVDVLVKRTQTRPLAAGEVSFAAALILLLVLLFFALIILIQLPKICFYYALAALSLTILYPFCKRFIDGPQLVLAIAFSLAIPMVFAASGQRMIGVISCLLFINFFWTVSYDTQYALADRSDDLRIGVRSTAILFGKHEKAIIGWLQLLFHSAWLLLLFWLPYSWPFFSCWFGATFVLLHQQKLIANCDSTACIQAFSSNVWYGVIMWLAVILSY